MKRGTKIQGPHKYELNRGELEPLFDGDLDYLIRMVRMRQVRGIELILEPFGPALSAWLPLIVLQSAGGMSQRELGNRLDIRDAAIGKTIEVMERSGLVERVVDSGDRRKWLVRLTRQGEEVATEVAAKRQQFLKVISAGFTPREIDKFCELLERAFRNMTDFIGQKPPEPAVEGRSGSSSTETRGRSEKCG